MQLDADEKLKRWIVIVALSASAPLFAIEMPAVLPKANRITGELLAGLLPAAGFILRSGAVRP
jgi:hypothetical protein